MSRTFLLHILCLNLQGSYIPATSSANNFLGHGDLLKYIITRFGDKKSPPRKLGGENSAQFYFTSYTLYDVVGHIIVTQH